MGRTAKTLRLTALALKRYADDVTATSPLHDGGGLYLRKRGSALHWVLRLSDPANGAQQWHRLFPDDPLRWASIRTSRWLTRVLKRGAVVDALGRHRPAR